jgi:hypothetical protein
MNKEKDAAASEWGREEVGERFERWPKDENGEPVPPAYLAHRAGLNMDDALLMSMLEASGIPSLRQYPGAGEFGMLILGVSGYGVDIYVPATQYEEACELLKGVEDLGEIGGGDGEIRDDDI